MSHFSSIWIFAPKWLKFRLCLMMSLGAKNQMFSFLKVNVCKMRLFGWFSNTVFQKPKSIEEVVKVWFPSKLSCLLQHFLLASYLLKNFLHSDTLLKNQSKSLISSKVSYMSGPIFAEKSMKINIFQDKIIGGKIQKSR